MCCSVSIWTDEIGAGSDGGDGKERTYCLNAVEIEQHLDGSQMNCKSASLHDRGRRHCSGGSPRYLQRKRKVERDRQKVGPQSPDDGIKNMEKTPAYIVLEVRMCRSLDMKHAGLSRSWGLKWVWGIEVAPRALPLHALYLEGILSILNLAFCIDFQHCENYTIGI